MQDKGIKYCKSDNSYHMDIGLEIFREYKKSCLKMRKMLIDKRRRKRIYLQKRIFFWINNNDK